MCVSMFSSVNNVFAPSQRAVGLALWMRSGASMRGCVCLRVGVVQFLGVCACVWVDLARECV